MEEQTGCPRDIESRNAAVDTAAGVALTGIAVGVTAWLAGAGLAQYAFEATVFTIAVLAGTALSARRWRRADKR